MAAHRARLPIIGAFALAALNTANAQRSPPTVAQLDHTVWTLRDGAPSLISSLAQSADGALWIANNVGLYRFDGVRFERFDSRPSHPLPSPAITEIEGMPDTSLWIGFFSGGVSVLAHGRVLNYTAGDGIPEGRINGIARDSTGATWVSSVTGLARLHEGRWRRMGPEQQYPGGNTGSIFVDRRGAVWAPTSVGMFVLPRGGSGFERRGASPDAEAAGAQTPREAPDGSVWGASLTLGLTRLSDPVGRPTPPNSAVQGLGRGIISYVDRHANAWIVRRAGGFVRVPLSTSVDQFPTSGRAPKQPTIETVPLVTGPNASAMLEDREGNMWVGTEGGLERFRQTALTPVVLPKDVLWPAIAPAADGSVWLGSYRYPVSLITDEILSRADAPSNVRCVYRDLDGGLWFGGSRGLWHVPPSSSPLHARFTPVALPRESEGTILAMARTLDGDLWVSTWSAQAMKGVVLRRHRGAWSLSSLPPGFSGQAALSIVSDSAGRVWLGYVNHVVLVVGDSTRDYSENDGLDVGMVTALHVSGAHLWIGGRTGLAIIKDDSIHAIATAQAIRDVTGIVETTNGDVWFNGTDGVTRIPAAEIHRTLKDRSYRVRRDRFGEDDGLKGQPVQIAPRPTAIQSADGRLWFTTSDGVAWIDPASITRNRLPPPVQVRALIAAGKTYDVGDRVSLPMRTTQVQVVYTAFSLARPDRVRFRYQLTKVDSTWVEAGSRREAFYTNLGPGSYRFRVIAAHEDDVWNDAGTSIDFEISPSFTQTKAFIGLVGVALVGAGWLLALWRQQQMARALHAKFEAQLAERARVARELHDTLLGDMGGVVLQLAAGARRAASANENAGIVELLSSLSKQVQHTVVEARRSVTGIRKTPAELTMLHQQLHAAAHGTFADTGIRAHVESAGTPRRYTRNVELEIVGIATEAMANARHHSGCQSVMITCSYAPRTVHVRVRDDGRGFDPSRGTPAEHWGLVGMRERAASIGARLTVTSAPGAGTEVGLVAPGRPGRWTWWNKFIPPS